MELTRFQRFDLAGVQVILFSFKPGFSYRSHETEIDLHADTRRDIQGLTGEELDEDWYVWGHEDYIIDGFNKRREIEWRFLLLHGPSYNSFTLTDIGRDDCSDIIDRMLNFTFVTWQKPSPMDIQKFIIANRIEREYRIEKALMSKLFHKNGNEVKDAQNQTGSEGSHQS